MTALKKHQALSADWDEREKLRDKGQFWTPSWVADAMVAYVLDEQEREVFDPATGRGAFLEALTRLDKTGIRFLGTDIDPECLADPIYQDTRCKVEIRDFIKSPPARKFQSIVANPPYIRHHRIDGETKSFLRQLCARITGFTIDGRAGYHIHFFLQALSLLKSGGRLAFIMPADTCEGTFAKKLWHWISKKYCIECVITFEEGATPFPDVDTNALVFLIRNSAPAREILWIKAHQAYSPDLLHFVQSGLKGSFKSLSPQRRSLEEALKTGLSRPEQNHNLFKYKLRDFAKVMRGIATGANDYFFLTRQQCKELHLPNEILKAAIGRTRDVSGDRISIDDIEKLDRENRPTLLLCVDSQHQLLSSVKKYLKEGEKRGLHERALIKQRRPWYKMEQRKVPPLLFAYLGRRNSRFIKNEAGIVPLTSFLCVYPICEDEAYVHKLWMALNHPDTIANLKLVGKSYGSGAIKVEPRNLDLLSIPEHLVEEFQLSVDLPLFSSHK
ncbi:MAG: N-6 DNA methylase [Pseudomonadota bacterium]